MQSIGFQEAVDQILAEDASYHAEAYTFLRDALEATLKRRKKGRKDASLHVSAAELLEGFRLHALQEFGSMTVMVMDYWGVRSCEDVGRMVFNLVRIGVFGKTDDDTLESFKDVYDFDRVFVVPFQPESDNLSGNPTGVVGRNA